MALLSPRVRMPALDGAVAWLNSEPLETADLRGRVVLVDFWTLTCINWLRTAPYVRAWADAYAADGLVVIGVHTPEFGFEKGVDAVRRATGARGIRFPVAVDSDYAIWSAFANHYWPALYFVDGDGIIRDHHFGEGRYEHCERVIQRLLGVERDLVSVTGEGDEADAAWEDLRSPETYLGYVRGERQSYETPGRLGLDQWALTGQWSVGAESALLRGPGGSVAYRFHARDAHLVLDRAPAEPIPFRVRLDGEPPGRAHGADVGPDGMGLLREGRMYQLVRQPGAVEDRTVEITFLDAGARAFAFTFG